MTIGTYSSKDTGEKMQKSFVKKYWIPIILSLLANIQIIVFLLDYRHDLSTARYIIGHNAGLFLFVLFFFPIALLLTFKAVRKAIETINDTKKTIERKSIVIPQLNWWFFTFSYKNRIKVFTVIATLSIVISFADVVTTALDFSGVKPTSGKDAVKAAQIIFEHRARYDLDKPDERLTPIKVKIDSAYEVNDVPLFIPKHEDDVFESGRYIKAFFSDNNRHHLINTGFFPAYFISLAIIVCCVLYLIYFITLLACLKLVVDRKYIDGRHVYCMELLIIAASIFLIWCGLRMYTTWENSYLLFGEHSPNLASIPAAFIFYVIILVLIFTFYYPGRINDIYYPITAVIIPGISIASMFLNPFAVRNIIGSNFYIFNLIFLFLLYLIIIVLMVIVWSAARLSKWQTNQHIAEKFNNSS